MGAEIAELAYQQSARFTGGSTMRSRQLTLGILFALASITIAASPTYAATSGLHTPLTTVNTGRVTLSVGTIDSAGNFTATSSVDTTTACTLSATATNGDPANSYKCFFGGGVLSVGGVQIDNYSTVSGDGARLVATASSTKNNLAVKNFVVKNTNATSVFARLEAEFTFPDTSNALTRTSLGAEGVGRGHGGNFKVKFFSCQSGACLANPTGDRFIGRSEFVYFDNSVLTRYFNQVGATTDAGIKVDYTVPSAGGADMGTKCYAEGSTSLVCPNDPPFTTKCPVSSPNFGGTCAPIENIYTQMIFGLAGNHRAQVLAGSNMTSANEGIDEETNQQIGACVGTHTFQLSESLLEGSCRVHSNETFGPGSGQTHLEFLGGGDIDLTTCDWENATAGLGGSGMVARQFTFLTLDNNGRRDDVSVSFEGDAGVGPGACGEGPHTADFQAIVSCPVSIACEDAEPQRNNPNKVNIISSTTGTFSIPLVCTLPAEITPCP